jgi:hypothetical protein
VFDQLDVMDKAALLLERMMAPIFSMSLDGEMRVVT